MIFGFNFELISRLIQVSILLSPSLSGLIFGHFML